MLAIRETVLARNPRHARKRLTQDDPCSSAQCCEVIRGDLDTNAHPLIEKKFQLIGSVFKATTSYK
jgi:hypothetical protein